MIESSDPRCAPNSGAENRTSGDVEADRSDQLLNGFAASLVQHVRDRSVLDLLAALRPDGVRRTTDEWATELDVRDGAPEFARAIVPDVVDLVVTNLLAAIDNRLLPLELTDEASGLRVPLSESGELAGTYLAEGGWRSRFSTTIPTSEP